jgi:hypothetical protein
MGWEREWGGDEHGTYPPALPSFVFAPQRAGRSAQDVGKGACCVVGLVTIHLKMAFFGIHLCAILWPDMTNIEPIHEFIFTDHALSEMARRQISEENVKEVLVQPEQTEMVREGRAVY